MPTIHRIGGIHVRIYADDTKKHRKPHFHAVGPDKDAAISLPELEVIAGRLDRVDYEAVMNWAENDENKAKLIQVWNRINPKAKIESG
jgi:hypothetical protein